MEEFTVNGYETKRYDEDEVFIQTKEKRLEANDGKVYLRTIDLVRLLKLADSNLTVCYKRIELVEAYPSDGGR